MNGCILSGFLSITLLLLPQHRQYNPNVDVAYLSHVFDKNITELKQIDLANESALRLAQNGRVEEQLSLKQGRGSTMYLLGKRLDGKANGFTEVRLVWQRNMDSLHLVVAYDWSWTAASSSQSQIVQIFELRDGKLLIVQQIEADTHHGGQEVGAKLNSTSHLLTVKTVELNSPKGRCCPTHIDVVTFRWEQSKFRRISAHQIPFQENK